MGYSIACAREHAFENGSAVRRYELLLFSHSGNFSDSYIGQRGSNGVIIIYFNYILAKCPRQLPSILHGEYSWSETVMSSSTFPTGLPWWSDHQVAYAFLRYYSCSYRWVIESVCSDSDYEFRRRFSNVARNSIAANGHVSKHRYRRGTSHRWSWSTCRYSRAGKFHSIASYVK